MSALIINTHRIIDNIKRISQLLEQNNSSWTFIVKMLGGNRSVLEKILHDESIKSIHSVGDSRISNLKIIKEIRPDIVTMYVKPPSVNLAKSVVKYSDISLNSSEKTIIALDKEARKLDKIHRIIVMIELGELREGILRNNVLSFYESIFDLKNIKIEGIGTNLGCMYGIEPTYDKLIQLNLYKLLIEEKFKHKLELISAGSSITLPLLPRKRVPAGMNHYRIGESVFLGTSPLDNKQFKNLSTNAFDFSAEIIELEKKENLPDGIISDAGIGHVANNNKKLDETYRAIVDFGAIDVDANNLQSKNKNVNFFGTTSDMTVYDIGKNKSNYKVGGQLHFKPNYMAVARLMSSKYIAKLVK